jgi:formylglycine-generating enzyme required for sulfatase activity
MLLLITALLSAPSHAPCQPAPPGMSCIEGGAAIVGSDEGAAAEKPKRSVEISTFYMDQKEITEIDYAACVAAGACQRLPGTSTPSLRPAVPLDWSRAHQFCTFAGKRLPTEFEWEKAARGVAGEWFPWGNDTADCSKAHTQPCPRDTESEFLVVGSKPAQRYGLYDMAGNVFEWTATWASASARACGDKCSGLDPQGPCDGAHPCASALGQKKVLKGGSWYWPASLARASVRRFEGVGPLGHRVGARCASSHPYLTRFVRAQPRAAPPPFAAPTAEQQKLAHDITTDALKKPVCEGRGRSFVDCRDPAHYVVSNEPRSRLWRPYVEHLGGGYVGVGIDQNYTLMAHARSEWAWLFDYDPTIVKLHHVLRALILAAPDRVTYLSLFTSAKRKEAEAVLRETYANDASLPAYLEIFRLSVVRLEDYFRLQAEHKLAVPDITKAPGADLDKPRRIASVKTGDAIGDDTFGWLATDDNYQFIRTLFQQDRVVLLEGDMLGNQTMQGIGRAARALQVPVRIYYGSNAPESWPFTKQYRDNVLALPFDEHSVALQTLSGLKSGFGQKGYWHHHVQAGLHQQWLLQHKGYASLRQLVFQRVKTDDGDLTTSGLRSE